jgi:hypothetical protein
VDYEDEHDANSKEARIVKAGICAGFYPQILRVENPLPKFTKIAGTSACTRFPCHVSVFEHHTHPVVHARMFVTGETTVIQMSFDQVIRCDCRTQCLHCGRPELASVDAEQCGAPPCSSNVILPTLLKRIYSERHNGFPQYARSVFRSCC